MYKRPLRSDELYHWGMKKGAKAEKHKYIARIEDGTTILGTPKYRYFYTQAELAAWRAQKNPQQKASQTTRPPIVSSQSTSQSAQSVTSTQPRSSNETNISGIKDAAGDIKNKIKNFFNDHKKELDDTKETTKETTKDSNLIDKAKQKIDSLFNAFDKDNDNVERDKDDRSNDSGTTATDEPVKDEENGVEDRNRPKKDKTQYIDSLSHTSMEDLKKAEKDAQKIYEDAQDQTLDDLKPQEYELTNEENASLVNPYYMYDWMDANFDGQQEGNKYTDNCSHCTLAYDMRMRGYDVEATPSNEAGGETFDEIETWYEDGKFSYGEEMLQTYWEENLDEAKQLDTNDPEAVTEFYAKAYINEMAKGGPGARGQFCVYWQAGGGHSMAYEVNDNGSVDIVDCQNNTRVKAEDFDWSSIYLNDGGVMRTDNLKLTDRAATKVINKENTYSNTNRSDAKDTNDKIDDAHADYFMKDGQQWFYRYERGVRMVMNPNTGNWTKG